MKYLLVILGMMGIIQSMNSQIKPIELEGIDVEWIYFPGGDMQTEDFYNTFEPIQLIRPIVHNGNLIFARSFYDQDIGGGRGVVIASIDLRSGEPNWTIEYYGDDEFSRQTIGDFYLLDDKLIVSQTIEPDQSEKSPLAQPIWIYGYAARLEIDVNTGEILKDTQKEMVDTMTYDSIRVPHFIRYNAPELLTSHNDGSYYYNNFEYEHDDNSDLLYRIIHLDSNGHLIDEKRLDFDMKYNRIFLNYIRENENAYWISRESLDIENGDKYGYLEKYDARWNLIWSQQYADSLLKLPQDRFYDSRDDQVLSVRHGAIYGVDTVILQHARLLNADGEVVNQAYSESEEGDFRTLNSGDTYCFDPRTKDIYSIGASFTEKGFYDGYIQVFKSEDGVFKMIKEFDEVDPDLYLSFVDAKVADDLGLVLSFEQVPKNQNSPRQFGWMLITFEALGIETATEGAIESNLLVAPNPTSDYLSVSSQDMVRRVELWNTNGQKMKVITSDFDRIYIGDLSSGTYFLNIHYDHGMTHKKIVKQ